MAYQAVFKRYELKYRLNQTQKEELLRALAPHMTLDKYGRTLVQNIYFDTDSWLLIRRSIEKPAYKEKLRLRRYLRADQSSSEAFVELKKKYNKIVYKRRISLTEQEAMDWLCGRKHCGQDNQIVREIDYFLSSYPGIHPAVLLSYEREAFFSNDGSDFRVTFDENILFRQSEFSFSAPPGGTSLLAPGESILEIKCSGGIPMWMTEVLSRVQAYKTSFSKYGTAYREHIFPKL